jgi:hypothetical protein
MRTAIEEDTKQAVSMSSWAEASGVDDKVLKQQLYHGYYCKEELLRSTRSLVLYFARKYRGMGIALEDLLQVCSNFHCVVFRVRYIIGEELLFGFYLCVRMSFIHVNYIHEPEFCDEQLIFYEPNNENLVKITVNCSR